MKNKIIIGDIDVTECNFRLERDNQQKCECCHATGFGVICDCEKWHNCYFKQLKRVEQKLEKIKSICTPICQMPDEYCGMKNVYQHDEEDVEKKILNIIEGEENE